MIFLQFSECECDIRGIAPSNGCNQVDGQCTCKRNVAATRNCDQCAEEHYGLSESDPLGKIRVFVCSQTWHTRTLCAQ